MQHETAAIKKQNAIMPAKRIVLNPESVMINI
jgi:hypothetical protein